MFVCMYYVFTTLYIHMYISNMYFVQFKKYALSTTRLITDYIHMHHTHMLNIHTYVHTYKRYTIILILHTTPTYF